MLSNTRIGDDFTDDIAEITVDIFRRDNRKNRRRVYYLASELAPQHRPAGLFKLGGKICLIRSLFRADLQRRALAATNTAETTEIPADTAATTEIPAALKP